MVTQMSTVKWLCHGLTIQCINIKGLEIVLLLWCSLGFKVNGVYVWALKSDILYKFSDNLIKSCTIKVLTNSSDRAIIYT